MAHTPPPSLNITVTPKYQGRTPKSLDVRLVIEKPDLTASKTLVRLTDVGDLFPAPPYTGANAVQALDSKGEVPLILADTSDGERQWNVARETAGDVTVTYSATHINNDSAPTIALLDLRRDHDGINGAGMSLFVLPPEDKTYSINLAWDLRQAPEGSRAVWNYGEGPGTVTTIGSTKVVSESHFAVGPSMNSYPPSTSDTEDFGFYWFEQPDFEVVQLAEWTQNLFHYMKRFFHDTEPAYRIYMRGSASSSGTGGAALLRSFMFSYIMGANNTWESFQTLLSHEMVHNWPTLSHDDDVTWYVEGIADYYSMILPFRLGAFTLDRLIQGVNNMATAYYTNPMINLTNAEIEARSSESDSIERVPYGRGMFFLVRLDAQIRARSNGTRSIDDVVLNLLNRTRSGQSDRLEDFLSVLEQELGSAARDEYEQMANGRLLVPPGNSLSPCLAVQKTQMELYEFGFEKSAKNGKSFITKVVPNSRAAQAGLMDGDEVVSMEDRFSNPTVIAAYEDVNAETLVKIRRNAEELLTTYRPRRWLSVTEDIRIETVGVSSYYLTTTIIMDLVGKPTVGTLHHGWPFGDTVTPVVNVLIKYIYIILLVVQFILALGNRPKGSKYTYIASFMTFGLIQCYILILSFYLVYRAIDSHFGQHDSISSTAEFVQSLLGNSVAGVILLALITIYGLNFLASFIYLDPWHMFHSFPRYLLLASTFTNIVMVYAFNNWHDVSWGTKGADMNDALPSALVVKDEDANAMMVEEVQREQEDIDTQFEKTVHRALAAPEEESMVEKRDLSWYLLTTSSLSASL
ncbi:hypothetical protein ACJ41O_000254 [Fusarium nematophilum]